METSKENNTPSEKILSAIRLSPVIDSGKIFFTFTALMFVVAVLVEVFALYKLESSPYLTPFWTWIPTKILKIVEADGVSSFFATVGFVSTIWVLIAYFKKKPRSDYWKQLKNVLSTNFQVSPALIGFIAIAFVSLWASLRKLGIIFLTFLGSQWTVGTFTAGVLSAIGLLLLIFLSYTLFVAVGGGPAKGWAAVAGILGSTLVALLIGLLTLIPQVIDPSIYLYNWRSFPIYIPILLIATLSGAATVLAFVMSHGNRKESKGDAGIG